MANKLSTSVETQIDRESAEAILDFGEYWRFMPQHSVDKWSHALKASNIYLIVDLLENLITEQVQTVKLYLPAFETKSGGKGSKVRIDIDEFLMHFIPVDKETAKAEREALLKNLNDSAEQLNNDIQLALSDPRALLTMIGQSNNPEMAVGREALHQGLALPSPETVSSVSRELIANGAGTRDLAMQRLQLENQAKLGELAGQLAEVKSTELQTVLLMTQDLMMEHAEAVKGKAADMQRRVSGVLKKVDTIKYYLGEEVDVHILIEGDGCSATDIGPYTLYPKMVAMDEELAILRIFADNEFDYTQQEDFFKQLKESKPLRDRIFPLERCIVAIRPRKHSHGYHNDENLTMYDWIYRNRQNLSSFLMVRNGEQYAIITSPIDYKQRLYPTDSHMAAFFEGVMANDTTIVDRQRDFEADASDFRAIIAILQGVIDREAQGTGAQIFGQMPKEKLGCTFMSPGYFEQNLQFINDEDFVMANPDVPKDIRGWFADNRSELKATPGDWIVYSRFSLEPGLVPGAYVWRNRSGNYEKDWDFTYDAERIQSSVLKRFKGQLCFPVMLNKDGKQRSFRAHLEYLTQDILIVSKLSLVEVEAILSSREYREELTRSGDMELLVEARLVLKKAIQDGQHILNYVVDSLPDASLADQQRVFMQAIRHLKPDAVSHTTLAKAKRYADQAIKTYQQYVQTDPNEIEQFAEHLRDAGEKPLYYSISSHGVFLVSAAQADRKDLGVQLEGIRCPYFLVHQLIDTPQKIWHEVGLVPSDIHSYPVTGILTNRINKYGLLERRFNARDLEKLTENVKLQTETIAGHLKQIDGLLRRADEQELQEAIQYYLDSMTASRTLVTKSHGYVTFGDPMVITIVKLDKFPSAEGIAFSFAHALALLFQHLSTEFQALWLPKIKAIFQNEFCFNWESVPYFRMTKSTLCQFLLQSHNVDFSNQVVCNSLWYGNSDVLSTTPSALRGPANIRVLEKFTAELTSPLLLKHLGKISEHLGEA
ncbi:hypothetical protein [Shewanella colwelliana]|uniref:hypothetical protein n=1 Tax=Shewanella colwelliana TaxID=23 RepID=UPI0022B07605|nr:hypothetical protein [Shewanella colwelliana]MCZ4337639.1 hypothetical protein [Shewanella colwelliana]